MAHPLRPPEAPADAGAFEEDLRESGCQGRITMGEDLTSIRL